MKKIFAIVLAGIMMLSLAACGGTGSSTPAAASSEPAGASGTPASGEPGRQHAVRQGDHGRFHLG